MENPVDHDVIPAVRNRYSAYRYQPRGVEDAKLLQCLEAARWAASSYNDQPWSWIMARREDDCQILPSLEPSSSNRSPSVVVLRLRRRP